jgi:hypothetical protein
VIDGFKISKIIKIATELILVSFVLHIVWENVQAPLYQGYVSFFQHFSPCMLGTVGDISLTIFVYLAVALLKNNIYWITGLNKKDILVLTVVGFFAAVQIEQQALLFGQWGYASSMPLVPYFGAGLTPVLQMTILLPVSMYITNKINGYKK